MFFFLVLWIQALFSADSDIVLTEDFIAQVNSLAKSWKGSNNESTPVHGATRVQAKALCGVLPGGPVLPQKQFNSHKLKKIVQALPTNWDARVQWPYCPTMKNIRDQSACGSCWAFGAVEAMSDRSCIFLKKNLTLSAPDMAFCCSSCGYGCNGGWPAAAWSYYQQTGLVEEGCWPYPFPSCDHHIPNSKHPCPSKEYPSPPCPSQCNAGWDGPAWNNDLHMASSSYTIQGEDQIMAELFKNGPVEAAFSVYEDFLSYKSGVYQHVSGSYLGGHAIKILGWGVEGGLKYWLVANSWNYNWGDQGYFKILKGSDECGIEDDVCAGIPSS